MVASRVASFSKLAERVPILLHSGMSTATLDPGVASPGLDSPPVLAHNDHQQTSPFLIWCTYRQMKTQGKERAHMVEMETLRMTLARLIANSHLNIRVLKEVRKAVKRREMKRHGCAEVVITLPYPAMMPLLGTLDILTLITIPMNVERSAYSLIHAVLLDWLWGCW
jgi:hypothetical protein